jgi:hypothetical protein
MIKVKGLRFMDNEKSADNLACKNAKVMTAVMFKLLEKIYNYGFTALVQRAYTSIMNNSSEDFERKVNEEYRYFIYVTKDPFWKAQFILLKARTGNNLSQ